MFKEISFNGERLVAELRECTDRGVPGDSEEGISRGSGRCGVCGGAISLAGDSGGGGAVVAFFVAFIAGLFLTFEGLTD